jgi:hypothetical protein
MQISRIPMLGLFVLTTTVARAQGSISGTVFDSLRTRTPLANATVVLIERSKYATTDPRGHFRLDSVPDGRYTLGFMHPMLDSLDIEPPTVSVVVAGGREAIVTLFTPGPAAAVALMCPDVRDPEAGVIVGHVRDVDDHSALASATVGTDWTEFSVTTGKQSSQRIRAAIKTKPSGVYLLCGVPINVPLQLQAEWDGRVVGPTALQLDARLIGRAEFAVSKRDTASRGDLQRETSVIAAAVPGTATLRGVVRGADAKPLRDASVSVMGTARSARTDDKGAFHLDHIPAGTRAIEAKSVGLMPTVVSIAFATNGVRDTAFAMTRAVQDLKTVAIEAKLRMTPLMERSGFNERKIQAMGAFITEEDISKHGYSDLISLLQGTRGIHVERGAVSRSESGISFPMAYMKGVVSVQGEQPGHNCIPNFYVDGSLFIINPAAPYQDFSHLSGIANPSTIRGIEVYSNPGTIPAQYDRMSSTGCGSVVIWTR